jgi:hypothetical protein
MDPNAPRYPDTPIPVHPPCPAAPATKRPWAPPLLTTETILASKGKTHEPLELGMVDHGPAS